MDRNIIEIPLENRQCKRNGRSIIIKNQGNILCFEVRDRKNKLFGDALIIGDEKCRFMRRWLGRAIRKQENE